jgi:hypothetical protein
MIGRVLLFLLITMSAFGQNNVVAINPKAVDVPATVEPASSAAASYARFDAAIAKSEKAFQSAREEQNVVIAFLRASNIGPSYFQSLEELKKRSKRTAEIVEYVSRVVDLDKKWIAKSDKRTAAYASVIKDFKDEAVTLHYISELQQQQLDAERH